MGFQELLRDVTERLDAFGLGSSTEIALLLSDENEKVTASQVRLYRTNPNRPVPDWLIYRVSKLLDTLKGLNAKDDYVIVGNHLVVRNTEFEPYVYSFGEKPDSKIVFNSVNSAVLAMVPAKYTHFCKSCFTPFFGVPNAKYCSSACRKTARRKKK